MKYTLPKNYYLENLDNRNWIVYKNFKDKNEKIKKDIKGFYPTLKMAVDSAIDMFAPPVIPPSGTGGGTPIGAPAGVPIDGGLGFLLAAGVAYGGKKLKDRKKAKADKEI